MSKHNATAILDRCRQAGLKVWKNGERIGIAPARLCPPELLETIRAAKPQLLVVLAATDVAPTEQPAPTHQGGAVDRPDLPGPEILRDWPTGKPASRPVQRGGTDTEWLHVAKQVLAGEFDGGDCGLIETLLVGVRANPHPACQEARARLQTMLVKRKETR